MIGVPTNEQAHKILDAARLGMNISPETIDLALLATGDLSIKHSNFPSIIAMKQPLHIKEARCAGRDPKSNTEICSDRNSCARHRQLEIDRKMGLDVLNVTKTYALPRVRGNDCTYWLAAE